MGYLQNGTYDDQSIKFGKNAYAATSLLNELSERYTMMTGYTMTREQANLAINGAVNGGFIDAEKAFVNDWDGAANAMWKIIHPVGGSFTYNENSTQHVIYAIEDEEDKDNIADHFVNGNGVDAEGNLTYYDPYNGNTGLVDNLTLQEGRPTRQFSYVP